MTIMTTNGNEERPLPDGWTWTTIIDLILPNGIFSDGDWVESKDQDPNGNIRLIQLADIGDGYYRDRSRRLLT
jgi:type I restriction enzyme S subunit